jgi:hypothetical protein
MSTTERFFAEGAIVKKSTYGFKISIKKDEFVKFLNANTKEGGWVNLELKETIAGGKFYLELDTWKPAQSGTVEGNMATNSATQQSDDLPF